MALSNDKKEWPDTIEETGCSLIVVNHQIVISRHDFDNGIGRFALAAMHKGTSPLRSTEEVRKYILEFEIID